MGSGSNCYFGSGDWVAQSSALTCVAILRRLISALNLGDASFTIFEHHVALNWRQQYLSSEEKLQFIEQGLVQQLPLSSTVVLGADILSPCFNPCALRVYGSTVMSVSSRLTLQDGTASHLALMNLHPSENLKLEQVGYLVSQVTGNMPGFLLYSGRYYHFYGEAILAEHAWLRFLSQFLMPDILVSPRYIGHSLYRGYTALRLSTNLTYKPILPFLIRKLT